MPDPAFSEVLVAEPRLDHVLTESVEAFTEVAVVAPVEEFVAEIVDDTRETQSMSVASTVDATSSLQAMLPVVSITPVPAFTEVQVKSFIVECDATDKVLQDRLFCTF